MLKQQQQKINWPADHSNSVKQHTCHKYIYIFIFINKCITVRFCIQNDKNKATSLGWEEKIRTIKCHINGAYKCTPCWNIQTNNIEQYINSKWLNTHFLMNILTGVCAQLIIVINMNLKNDHSTLCTKLLPWLVLQCWYLVECYIESLFLFTLAQLHTNVCLKVLCPWESLLILQTCTIGCLP